MMTIAEIQTGRHVGVWRVIGWGGAALLLALPAIAMQFTREVNWDATDFLFAGAMFLTFGGLLELAVRSNTSRSYRIGAGIALLTSFLIIWINAAVGMVGSEDNPFNLLFSSPIVAMIAGAVACRGDADGLARSAWVACAFQGIVGLLGAMIDPVGLPIAIVFCGLWAASAWMFRRARQG